MLLRLSVFLPQKDLNSGGKKDPYDSKLPAFLTQAGAAGTTGTCQTVIDQNNLTLNKLKVGGTIKVVKIFSGERWANASSVAGTNVTIE